MRFLNLPWQPFAWAALFGALAFALAQLIGLAGEGRAARACYASAGPGTDISTKCPKTIVTVIDAERRSRACDAALGRRDLFAQRAACSAAVKRLAAELEAANAELAGAEALLARERRDTAAAVARAEARATTTTTRNRNAEAAILAAPRAADGLVDCDARCMRALDGAVAAR